MSPNRTVWDASTGAALQVADDTPIFIEPHDKVNQPRDQQEALASLGDLVPAGTLAHPSDQAGGRTVAEARWYIALPEMDEDLQAEAGKRCRPIQRTPPS